MPSIRSTLPYAHLWDPKNGHPDMGKVQAYVSLADKRTVVAALGGDDSILTFVIQHAFEQTAEFIRLHGLNTYTSDNHERVLRFIRDRAPARAPRLPASSVDAGPGADSQPASSSVPRKSAVGDKSDPGRVRRDVKAKHGKEG